MINQPFSSAPVPGNFNMARYVFRNAGVSPDHSALLIVGTGGKLRETWTYAGLETAVLRAGFLLKSRRKSAPESRVLIRMKNTSAYAIAFFGAIAVGLVPVPVSPDLTARELGYIAEHSGASAVILDRALAYEPMSPGVDVIDAVEFMNAMQSGMVADFALTRADDPAFLVYTSGTTASPKGVLHAHRSAWGRRPMYDGWYGLRASDRLLHAGTMNWTYTLGTGITDPLANGATALVYVGEKTPEIWLHLMREHGVTIFASVPGVLRQILKYTDIACDTVPVLRHVLCAGEALPDDLAAEWRSRTGTGVYQALGQTELSTYISTSPTVPPKAGTVGKPQRGRRIVILSEVESLAAQNGETPLPANTRGLIACHRSDPGLMLGYFNQPDVQEGIFRGDWFLGGDVGEMDDEGYIIHHGRANDLMNAGGFRVSPWEVEQQLCDHPIVAEVAVAEVAVRAGVTIIAAFIVLRDGQGADEASLRAQAGERLAVYKRPKHYEFVASLPRTANGKVKRSSLTVAGAIS